MLAFKVTTELERYHMQDTSGKAGTSLGHVEFDALSIGAKLLSRSKEDKSVLPF